MTFSREDMEKSAVKPQFPLVTVGALVQGSSGRILIVETTKWKGTWGVPGGKVEWGESLEVAVAREFMEEVGLKLTDIRFAMLHEAILDPQFYKEAHFVMVNYWAVSDSEDVVPNEEIVRWEWVTPEVAFDYPLNSYTRILIEKFRCYTMSG
ncbi:MULTISPECIES: NUDIX domain-containing protein [unclassified Okeania]|uniref:NUDIX domain-containing protein n=1 Tax=unclassified Okeania TaxID=2634635 RepID=UPI0025F129DC|nr:MULTISPECIES: NUDIX domain-containing protein [unclassified Okeania]